MRSYVCATRAEIPFRLSFFTGMRGRTASWNTWTSSEICQDTMEQDAHEIRQHTIEREQACWSFNIAMIASAEGEPTEIE